MKFQVTASFEGDRARLTAPERRAVANVLPAFIEACDRFARDPSAAWPASLRVKSVQGAPGVFEVTFSFAGPDVRATFEWVRIDGELAVRWRRIGGHEVLDRP